MRHSTTLGVDGAAFSKSRDASVCVGLAPRQYGCGGKANIVGLSKEVGNRKLRSVLIQGALTHVYRTKEPRSCKDRWLEDLIERAGQRRATLRSPTRTYERPGR
jgi:transposase